MPDVLPFLVMYEFLGRFVFSLTATIKSSTFEDSVLSHLKKRVQFGNDCVVLLSLARSDTS